MKPSDLVGPPTTSNFSLGLVVPIPTLPFASITILSVRPPPAPALGDFVANTRPPGYPLVPPAFNLTAPRILPTSQLLVVLVVENLSVAVSYRPVKANPLKSSRVALGLVVPIPTLPFGFQTIIS